MSSWTAVMPSGCCPWWTSCSAKVASRSRRSMPSPSAADRVASPESGWQPVSRRGWHLAPDLGVVPVSDLAAVARRVIDLQPGVSRILVVNDARMREVYWGHFAADPLVAPVGDEHVSPGAQVELPAGPGTPWAAAGRGLVVMPELAERCRAGGSRVVSRPVAARAGDPAAGAPGGRRRRVAVPRAGTARLCQKSRSCRVVVIKLQ